MSQRTRYFSLAVVGLVLGLGTPRATAQVVVLDDFEGSMGHFSQAPGFSGTSAGFIAANSTTALDTTTPAYSGVSSLRVNIDDDPATTAADGTAWRVRLLSGGGTPANNVSLSNNGTAFVGYWLRTTTAGLRASVLIDDGAALERAIRTPIIADGQWHPYEWALAGGTAQWEPFAGTAPNGVIDQPTVTIDAIYIDSPLTAPGADQDALFNIDAVSYNPTGSIVPVPEPSTLALVGVGGLGLLARRFRRRRT